MPTTHTLRYGETNIEYTLTYAARKTVAIDVHPDATVVVKAPETADPAAVEAFVRRRAPWILRKQREFARYPTEFPPRRYISGETFTYLGRQYRLRVNEGERESVKLSRGYLDVTTPNKRDTDHVRIQVEAWLHKQARRVFYERMLALLPALRPANPARTRTGHKTS